MASTDPVRVIIRIEPTVEPHEIARDRWNAMTPAERREHCDGIAEAAIQGTVAGWRLEDPDDEASIEEG